ncbi:MAG: hypothetical protein AAGJ97_07735 [Planctomycetota bacterium]
MLTRSSAKFGVIAATLCIGCADQEKYPFAPVSGVVTIDGVPAANIRVRFQPLPAAETGQTMESPPASSAITDQGGRFVMRKAVGDADNGAFVGGHSVVFEGLEALEYLGDDELRELRESGDLPSASIAEASRAASIEVPSDGLNDLTFALSSDREN